MTFETLSRAGVVIVNYNSADLSYSAALSALGAKPLGKKTRVVIIDNASPDGSFKRLQELAERHAAFHEKPVNERVHFAGRADVTTAVARSEQGQLTVISGNPDQADLVVIRSDRNGGFASGCNIGLKFLKETDTDLFLLLNPDTQIETETLRAFSEKLTADQECGLAGATLLGMEAPHLAQACGGASVSSYSLLGQNLGADTRPDQVPATEAIEKHLDYPVGAAMACRRDFLDHAGLMDERYFLFYEELDWVMAGRRKFSPGWAQDAVVYHHRGAVAGSHLGASHRSPLADYHMIRSRFLFALKWKPWLLPVLCALAGVQALRRLGRGQRVQAEAVLRGTLPGAPRVYRQDV